MAATTINAQDFVASPAEGSTIMGSELGYITLTWPEGTTVEVDEWGYMEIKTLASYEASEEDDLFWSYVGYAFTDTWTVEGSSVTVKPDYCEVTEDGTYVVVIESGSFYINGQMLDRIALKYEVVADAAPKIELAVDRNMQDGKIVITIPEGYTLSSVADDAQMVITDGEDYVCDAVYVGAEGDKLYVQPAMSLEAGNYYVSIMDGTFLFNDDTVANAYIYSRFKAEDTSVGISQLCAEQGQAIYNLMGQRVHHIGRGLHVTNGKVVIK